jgi:hypothetical protein
MKSKILTKLFLFVSLSVIYITMSSDEDGKAMNGTNCSACHGSSATTTTSVVINGLPTTFETNKTYPLTFDVTNATNLKAGCNVAVTGGTLIVGTNTKLKSSQITHILPTSATGTTTTFQFSWKAPATTASVTFNAVGNAVNGNGNEDNGDQWNMTSVTIPGSFPSSVNDMNELSLITCYPNPASDYIIAQGIGNQAENIKLFNLFGQKISSEYLFQGNDCKIDCSKIAKGMYILSAIVNGKIAKATFIKN